MKVYQSCGTISFQKSDAGKEQRATIKTMLPNLKTGTYRYAEFYNISNEKYFGLLGILVMDGEDNVNLRQYPTTAKNLKSVKNSTVNLLQYKPVSGEGKSFSELKEDDKIHFMCLHDDRFKGDSEDLEYFQANLPNFPALMEALSEEINREPKVGDGGILTANGC